MRSHFTKSTGSSFVLIALVYGLTWMEPWLGAQPGDAAAKRFQEARARAEKGDLEGQTALGMCYQFGQGVAADPVEAVKWFRKAAEQNFGPAQWQLGRCYVAGNGVAQNFAEGMKWHRMAAEQDLPMSQTELGSAYLDGNGVLRDETEATKWFRRAAEQGWTTAQFLLGGCYRDGRGVGRDAVEAYAWMNLAATAERPDRIALRNRDALQQQMSPQQLEQAKKRTDELRAKVAARKAEPKAWASMTSQPGASSSPPHAVPAAVQGAPTGRPAAVAVQKPQAGIQLTGIIALSNPTALLEVTDGGGTVKNVTVKKGQRLGSIEILEIDSKNGQITIRDSGMESVLRLKTK